MLTVFEYKKEIEKYLEKFDTEEQTIQTTRTHIKLSIYSYNVTQNTLEFYPKRTINK